MFGHLRRECEGKRETVLRPIAGTNDVACGAPYSSRQIRYTVPLVLFHFGKTKNRKYDPITKFNR